PMAFLLFPAEDVGVYVLPLMIFHIIQLLVCAVIAKHYARLAVEEEEQFAAQGSQPDIPTEARRLSTDGTESRTAPPQADG
ncbi:MAG TPA: bile acid:sodium symporter, partial [Candidatus Brevibacterium intestinavium]|nr:bile acid:sodium symporter [Candidatus Brevibacterium intestinavium]